MRIPWCNHQYYGARTSTILRTLDDTGIIMGSSNAAINNASVRRVVRVECSSLVSPPFGLSSARLLWAPCSGRPVGAGGGRGWRAGVGVCVLWGHFCKDTHSLARRLQVKHLAGNGKWALNSVSRTTSRFHEQMLPPHLTTR